MSAKKQLTAKENDVIKYYVDPTSETRGNWGKSYLKAGYSECKGWKVNAYRIHAKDYIKTAIEALRLKIEKKIDVSREYCIEKLRSIAENGKTDRDIMTALGLIADFKGYKRELAPNVEKEAEKAAKLSKEDKEIARIKAIKRCNDIAEGHHHKLNAG